MVFNIVNCNNIDDPTLDYPQPYNLIGNGPENAELRVAADFLARELTGLTILSIQWDEHSRYAREVIKGYAEVLPLFPATIQGITVKGKQLIFILESMTTQRTFYMMSFFGMEGRWTFIPGDHSNLLLKLGIRVTGAISADIVTRIVYFDDSRHFGAITFYPDQASLMTKLNTIGPDILAYALYLKGQLPSLPVSEHITPEVWRAKFRNKRLVNKEVGVFLLDQGKYSGIGNYARSDALYQARVSPHRPLGLLTDSEIEALRLAALDIVYRSYMAQGCTIKSYQTPYGSKGDFRCVVYKQSVCPLGHPVIKTKTKDKRTAHWVPNVQT